MLVYLQRIQDAQVTRGSPFDQHSTAVPRETALREGGKRGREGERERGKKRIEKRGREGGKQGREGGERGWEERAEREDQRGRWWRRKGTQERPCREDPRIFDRAVPVVLVAMVAMAVLVATAVPVHARAPDSWPGARAGAEVGAYW